MPRDSRPAARAQKALSERTMEDARVNQRPEIADALRNMSLNAGTVSGGRQNAEASRRQIPPSAAAMGSDPPRGEGRAALSPPRAERHLTDNRRGPERRTASATQRTPTQTALALNHPDRRTISATQPAAVRATRSSQRPEGRRHPAARVPQGRVFNTQQDQDNRQGSGRQRGQGLVPVRRADSPRTAALRPSTPLEEQLNDAYVAYERHTYGRPDRESDEDLFLRIAMSNDNEVSTDYFMRYYKSRDFQQKLHHEIRSLYVQMREDEAIALFGHIHKHLVVLASQGYMAPHPMTGCRQILPMETSGPHVVQLGENVALMTEVISSNYPFLHPDGAALLTLLRSNLTMRTILSDLRYLSSLSDGATATSARALTVDLYLRECGHPFSMTEARARWARQFPLLATHLPELAGQPPGLTRTRADPTFGLHPYPTPPTPLYQIPHRIL